jgi:cytochrome c peroxidase
MKSIASLIVFCIVFSATASLSDVYNEALKRQIMASGFQFPEEINSDFNVKLADIGKQFFESRDLSYNSEIACSDCHLKEFSSADGLPNAIGVGGHGVGRARLSSDGLVVPRNALALWGRGSASFSTFFWDGKVSIENGELSSQFLNKFPTDDPLMAATLLPIVEIREMILDDYEIDHEYKKEDVDVALKLYNKILKNVSETKMMKQLADHFGVSPDKIDIFHVGSSLAEHVKKEFALKETKLSQYMRGQKDLTDAELHGALLFYGKARCSMCHNGPLLSDLKFHTILFPQTGFGKNGFGIDYGRFNVTDKPSDLFKFRTPPLIEVVNTAPYGHSGSSYSIEEAINVHFDPFGMIDFSQMTAMERTNYFHVLQTSLSDIRVPFLDEVEIQNIKGFLETLSFVSE